MVITVPLVSPTVPDTLWVVNKSLLNEKIKEKIAVLGLSPKLALRSWLLIRTIEYYAAVKTHKV